MKRQESSRDIPSTSLNAANALRLDSGAARVVEVTDLSAMQHALQLAHSLGLSVMVLGDGTNVVLGPQISSLVVLMRNPGRSLDSQGQDCLLTADAGENWHDLVRFALAQGLFGIENLALIPGRVGAAPIQNIGAYGVELSEVFVRLEAIHRDTGKLRVFDWDECEFGYRTSIFKRGADNPWIIWRVTLRLSRVPRPRTKYKDVSLELARLGLDDPSPIDVAEAVVRVRRRKLPDPRHKPNVGSFFKNPVVSRQEAEKLRQRIADLVSWPMGDGSTCKLSAAQLIDRAGLKGLSMQGVLVWPRQPLVLVNEGASDRASFLVMAEHLQEIVYKKWGIRLEYEPDFYPPSNE